MAEPEEAWLQGPTLCLHASPPLHDVEVRGSAGQCAPCAGGWKHPLVVGEALLWTAL